MVEQKGAKDILISGLVDWGNSGVYPADWEYVRRSTCSPYGLRRETGITTYTYLPTQGIGCYIDGYFIDNKIDRIVN
jgi:hypothetical protein